MMRYIGKCLFIEERGEKVAVMGDLHLGYEEMLNKSGVYITRKMYEEMEKEMEEIFNEIGKVDYVVLLGDVKHEFSGNLMQEWNEVIKIMEFLKKKCKKLIVLRGNHDNYIGKILKKIGIETQKIFIWRKIAFVHGDEDIEEMDDKKIEKWIMGHMHPAIKLRDENKIRSEKYKCYLVGKHGGREVIIVPSFFSLIEGSDVREWEERRKKWIKWNFNFKNWNVFVVEGKKAFDFGKLNKISS